MITFGRKLNFVPLAVAIITGLIGFFLLDAILTLSAPLFAPCATFGGIAIFLLMICGYYPANLPYLTAYSEITKDHVRFYEYQNYGHKIKLLLTGSNAPMTMIKTSAIAKAEIYGTEKVEQMPTVATNLWLTWLFINKTGIIKNPYGIKLTLKDGHVIHISASYNKIRDPKQAVEKVNSALRLIQTNLVK